VCKQLHGGRGLSDGAPALLGAGHSSLPGLYRTRQGNLRTDGVAAVLGRALAHGRQPNDELWFGPGPLPAPRELAARYGDSAGLGVHLWPESARYLWLDRVQRQARRQKPPTGL
jgi:hypothetical protein